MVPKPLSVKLTRRARFSAAHSYSRPDWDDARNRAVFGEDVRLHGHNYVLEATVEGEVDPETGFAADLGALDAALAEVSGKLGYRDLSRGVEGLGDRVPTTENLALFAFRAIDGRLGAAARLVRVRLYESPDLYVDVTGAGAGAAAAGAGGTGAAGRGGP